MWQSLIPLAADAVGGSGGSKSSSVSQATGALTLNIGGIGTGVPIRPLEGVFSQAGMDNTLLYAGVAVSALLLLAVVMRKRGG